MDTALFMSAFVTLFVVIDPIGIMPIFLALTQGMTPQRRRVMALRAVLCAVLILTLFSLAGESVLGFLGISLAAFQIAGGLLLFFIAFEMLFEIRTKRRNEKGKLNERDEAEQDPSIFPLAMPLIAGPGAIASIILLIGQAAQAPLNLLVIYAAMLCVMAIVFTLFILAHRFESLLGDTGILLMTRLLGMLLAALSVQFVLNGLKAFGFGGLPA